ncbi:hypothetical protein K1719_040415 [Acacia pycnantha]|nr:hypothetical protein K1719_040415 [Acacia pycnantha]
MDRDENPVLGYYHNLLINPNFYVEQMEEPELEDQPEPGALPIEDYTTTTKEKYDVPKPCQNSPKRLWPSLGGDRIRSTPYYFLKPNAGGIINKPVRRRAYYECSYLSRDTRRNSTGTKSSIDTLWQDRTNRTGRHKGKLEARQHEEERENEEENNHNDEEEYDDNDDNDNDEEHRRVREIPITTEARTKRKDYQNRVNRLRKLKPHGFRGRSELGEDWLRVLRRF